MKLISDPPNAVKIAQMRSRVCYQQPALKEKNINQTYMILEDGRSQDQRFSFLVLGDSGSQSYHNDHPQRRVAKAMEQVRPDCRFALHTGDVVYLVGSKEQYPSNFIKPYQAFLQGSDNTSSYAYDKLVFKTPILPVLGNHDYYDLPMAFGILATLTAPLRWLFRKQITLDVGWHGSRQGNAYARAFLDYLRVHSDHRLQEHLDQHYTAQFNHQRCLSYRPEVFTRLPNRYYRFRYGSIDFFALDSNTFKQPLPIPDDQEGQRKREKLIGRKRRYVKFKSKLMSSSLKPEINSAPGHNDKLREIYVKLEQIEEQIRDVEQQLSLEKASDSIDQEQLDWLTNELIQSWQDPEAKGRVLFFHHPPYVTEATKWKQGETLAVRHHLRTVLDRVEASIGRPDSRPLVDLVLSGHAHCLEYLTTGETGHGDRHIPWLVCGGSGFSLRRQRREGSELRESRSLTAEVTTEANTTSASESELLVARSHLFVGRTGQGKQKRRPYSFIKIDVDAAQHMPQFRIVPHIVERFQSQWRQYQLEPIQLPQSCPH